MTAEKAQLLADAFAKRFNAHVQIEDRSGGRYRFEMYSKSFSGVPFLTRQDQAWAVVDQILGRDKEDDISLILTIGPEDVDASLVELMP